MPAFSTCSNRTVRARAANVPRAASLNVANRRLPSLAARTFTPTSVNCRTSSRRAVISAPRPPRAVLRAETVVLRRPVPRRVIPLLPRVRLPRPVHRRLPVPPAVHPSVHRPVPHRLPRVRPTVLRNVPRRVPLPRPVVAMAETAGCSATANCSAAATVEATPVPRPVRHPRTVLRPPARSNAVARTPVPVSILAWSRS